jgi:hypothetical protein
MEKAKVQTCESQFDIVVYAILCILTLGSVWLVRIIISHAIVMAVREPTGKGAVEKETSIKHDFLGREY